MRTLSIDLETFSNQDITDVGAHRYVDSPAFEILLFAYAFDEDPVTVIDLAGDFEVIPDEVVAALMDPSVRKTAHNAAFERICLAKHFGIPMPPEQWSCTQALSLYNGLPAALGIVAKALHLEQEKDTRGKALITYFCKPCKATKVNGGRTRNYPHHDRAKWAEFVEYCRQDVVVERAIRKYLRPLPPWEQKLWELDQLSNDRGIPVDMTLVDNAVELFDRYVADMAEVSRRLTGLENPNSVAQLKDWLETRMGVTLDSLDKAAVKNLQAQTEDPLVAQVLSNRLEMGKTSAKKFHLLQKATCSDGTMKGTTQYYGANRTGRFAGRLLQVQNLPQNKLPDLDLARRLLRERDYETLEMLFGNIPDTISQLIRTALVATGEGNTLNVCDFSAIEARVLAYLADEEWQMEVFRTHGKIYEAAAAQIFKIPLASVTKGSKERQKGKVASLACLAENTIITTSEGPVRIQDITEEMLLWDGLCWVHHGGVVFQGDKYTEYYMGLCATPDHTVFTYAGGEMPFIQAKIQKYNLQVGDGNEYRPTVWEEPAVRPTYDILNAGPRNRFTANGVLVHNCGYHGGVKALEDMDATWAATQTQEELQELVWAWREANPNIVQFWADVELAAKEAIRYNTTVPVRHGISFRYEAGNLIAVYPSGRETFYREAKLEYVQKFGQQREVITFWGMDQVKKIWVKQETYSGKLTENLCQGFARDCLAVALMRMYRAGMDILFHVHDEGITMGPETDLARMQELMAAPISWAPGLPLPADGYSTPYYRKD